MHISGFEQRFYPRLKDLALISKIELTTENKLMLEKFYNIKWKDKRIKAYFFFTPKAAMVCSAFRKMMKSIGKYLENKKEITKRLNKLISSIMNYEFVVNTNQEFIEYTAYEKKMIIKSIKKSKSNKIKKEELINKINNKRKIEFVKVRSKKSEKIPPPIISKLMNTSLELKFLEILSKQYFSDMKFDELINKIILIDIKDDEYLYAPSFKEAIELISKIHLNKDDLISVLNNNFNFVDILDMEANSE
tara:strand:+ start:15781 stop:16524 length:744 start_codon:yes stop_codon:yes gene_type:complete